MGVLACDRTGCTNIMCDRLSHTYGYICWECFDELVESDTSNIFKFMASDKRRKTHTEKRGREYYERIFQTSEARHHNY